MVEIEIKHQRLEEIKNLGATSVCWYVQGNRIIPVTGGVGVWNDEEDPGCWLALGFPTKRKQDHGWFVAVILSGILLRIALRFVCGSLKVFLVLG